RGGPACVVRAALSTRRTLLPPEGAAPRPADSRGLRPVRAPAGGKRLTLLRRGQADRLERLPRVHTGACEHRERLLRTTLDRRRAPPWKTRRCVLLVDAAKPPPLRAAQLHRQPARRDDACPRARPWRAPVAGARTRPLRAGHAAYHGRDCERVWRDAGVSPADAGRERPARPARSFVRKARGCVRHSLPPGRHDAL